MDVVKLLNDLTGGQLLLWKVVLASVVFALAGLQVFLAAASTRPARCRRSPPRWRPPCTASTAA
jgi:hypothetical protein